VIEVGAKTSPKTGERKNLPNKQTWGGFSVGALGGKKRGNRGGGMFEECCGGRGEGLEKDDKNIMKGGRKGSYE